MSIAVNLQEALIAALNAVPIAIEGTKVSVRDQPDTDQAYPYITVGDDTETDWSTNDKRGYEFTCDIHTWSQATGRTETKLLISQIDDALHNARIQVSGTNLIGIRFVSKRILFEDDAKTKHGVIRFRVRVLNN